MVSQRGPFPVDLTLRLPREVWHECLEYLPLTDKKSLSLASRLLNNISIPFVFECISYKYIVSCKKEDSIGAIVEQLDSFQNVVDALKMSAESPKHAGLIKKCFMSYYLQVSSHGDRKIREKRKEAYSSFVNTFVECLPRFSSLGSVEVLGFKADFDEKILRAFAEHPTLQAIELKGVRFGTHVIQSPIAVQLLVIDNRESRDEDSNSEQKTLELFCGSKLLTLQIWTTSYSAKIFRALTAQGTLRHLGYLSLSIDPADVSDLHAFLAQCPAIYCIQMEMNLNPFDISDVSLPSLPSSVVPLLESFSGPAPGAQAFIPGRPVERLEVQPHTTVEDIMLDEPLTLLVPLSKSTGPLTELFLESAVASKDVMGLIVDHLPSLEVLGVSVERPDEWSEGEMPDPFGQGKEDAGGYAAICAKAYEDPIGGGQDVQRKTHFFQVHFHTDYMNFLRLVTQKDISLPPNIKMLYLVDPLPTKVNLEYYFPVTDEQEADYVKGLGAPYSASQAQDIFRNLSERYAALEHVIINEKEEGGFIWAKGGSGMWTYSAYSSLSDFQASFQVNGDSDSSSLSPSGQWVDDVDYLSLF